jgi:hypothetical protein
VAGTSSIVKLHWGTTFTALNIEMNINERSVIHIIIIFYIGAAIIPEISVVNLLSDN